MRRLKDVIGLFAGRDLSDTSVTADFTLADLRLQASGAVAGEVPAGAPRRPDPCPAEAGQRKRAMIEHDGDGILAPLAKRWLSQLSWSAAVTASR